MLINSILILEARARSEIENSSQQLTAYSNSPMKSAITPPRRRRKR